MAVKGRQWRVDPMDVVPRTPGSQGIEVRSGYDGAKTFHEALIEGAVAAYPGYAPFSHAPWGSNTCCVCRVPRFDIDRYGRVVMPNAITNSVRIVDNAGNLILESGQVRQLRFAVRQPQPGRRQEGQTDRSGAGNPARPADGGRVQRTAHLRLRHVQPPRRACGPDVRRRGEVRHRALTKLEGPE